MLKDNLKLAPETVAFLRKAHLRPQPRISEGQGMLLIDRPPKTESVAILLLYFSGIHTGWLDGI